MLGHRLKSTPALAVVTAALAVVALGIASAPVRAQTADSVAGDAASGQEAPPPTLDGVPELQRMPGGLPPASAASRPEDADGEAPVTNEVLTAASTGAFVAGAVATAVSMVVVVGSWALNFYGTMAMFVSSGVCFPCWGCTAVGCVGSGPAGSLLVAAASLGGAAAFSAPDRMLFGMGLGAVPGLLVGLMGAAGLVEALGLLFYGAFANAGVFPLLPDIGVDPQVLVLMFPLVGLIGMGAALVAPVVTLFGVTLGALTSNLERASLTPDAERAGSPGSETPLPPRPSARVEATRKTAEPMRF